MNITLSFKIVDTGDNDWIHEDFRTIPPMDEWVRENFDLEDLFQRVGVAPEPGFYEFCYGHSSGDISWSAPSGSLSKEDRERVNALFFSLLKRYAEIISGKREQDLPKQEEIDLGAKSLLMEFFQRAFDKAVAHGHGIFLDADNFTVIGVCTRCGSLKACSGHEGSMPSVLYPFVSPMGVFQVGSHGRVQLLRPLKSDTLIITAGFVGCDESAFSTYLNREFAVQFRDALVNALPRIAHDSAINATSMLDKISAFRQKIIDEFQLDEAEIRERADEAQITEKAREVMGESAAE